jgi:hypothetical protein
MIVHGVAAHGVHHHVARGARVHAPGQVVQHLGTAAKRQAHVGVSRFPPGPCSSNRAPAALDDVAALTLVVVNEHAPVRVTGFSGVLLQVQHPLAAHICCRKTNREI